MATKDRSLVPDVIALRPFVPAKDFETSLRFFADLGFRAYRLGDLLASMHIGPFAFLLQGRPNDDERFAANFMMHMLVDDIDAWWSRIAIPTCWRSRLWARQVERFEPLRPAETTSFETMPALTIKALGAGLAKKTL